MNHYAAPDFWACYQVLPSSVREAANRAFALLRADPRHPSLHFKRVGEFWSVRVGLHHRAVGRPPSDETPAAGLAGWQVPGRSHRTPTTHVPPPELLSNAARGPSSSTIGFRRLRARRARVHCSGSIRFRRVNTIKGFATSNIQRTGTTKGVPEATSPSKYSVASLDCDARAQATPTDESATNPPHGRPSSITSRISLSVSRLNLAVSPSAGVEPGLPNLSGPCSVPAGHHQPSIHTTDALLSALVLSVTDLVAP